MDKTIRTLERARSADGTLLAYERRGDGPPLVLVGGALATAASDAPLAELLAARFTVLTYDRRGRGGSEDRAGYAVEREIEDLAAVIEAAGGRARVHGTASGGALALRAAAAGVPVAHLSVYQPPYDPAVRPGRAPGAHVARTRELVARGQAGAALALHLRRTGTPDQLVARMRSSPLWSGLEAVAHTLPYDDAVTGDGSVPHRLLQQVPVRVMVADGGASPGPVREAAKLVADALPRGHHRTLTGQTDEVSPYVLAPVLETFFAP
ncbi:alpha/beta fold hydrolase [Streptomyces tsukubensis]|uniref:Hydrolase n=1 Tax=Streptomyces tsukubensis (strain DSM 42081 / NBRC 108919 / NRRL 18488 / 9993) TaxID=1114943 RepID=A0A7G3UAF5_STRT9|nr:alpha/beta fold hydrolase [Streptomyces tsukubensis]AZK96666.1 hydrolase [Streptomyces tsukubensis]QKM67336.1 hydrolase [Streptomyces tsukubensis NRRL18488]TAI42039.1 alpha/beta fold hydrolase [Streptomyces tsukubensis]